MQLTDTEVEEFLVQSIKRTGSIPESSKEAAKLVFSGKCTVAQIVQGIKVVAPVTREFLRDVS